LFIDPDFRQVDAAAETGASYIELHTGTFCNLKGRSAVPELRRLVSAAIRAHGAGLKVNAGHGISLDNIGGIFEIPFLDTLNIGHSIVSRAVFVGLHAAVREFLEKMAGYRGGAK
jgi:pyridoxine 5-phosphate synthase